MANLTMFAFDLGKTRVSLLITDREEFLKRLRDTDGVTAVSSHLTELVLELDGSKSPAELLKEIQQLVSYTSFRTIQLEAPPGHPTHS